VQGGFTPNGGDATIFPETKHLLPKRVGEKRFRRLPKNWFALKRKKFKGRETRWERGKKRPDSTNEGGFYFEETERSSKKGGFRPKEPEKGNELLKALHKKGWFKRKQREGGIE